MIFLTLSFLITAQNFAWEELPHFQLRDEFWTEEGAEDRVQILWWNIEHGLSSSKNSDDETPLEFNLNNLFKTAAQPDVLIFGEYENQVFSKDFMDQLRDQYPQQKFLAYNTQVDQGIFIVSKIPFEVLELKELGFEPTQEGERSIQAYLDYWTRDNPSSRYYTKIYSLIKFQTAAGEFHLTPFHSLNHMTWRLKKLGGGPINSLKVLQELASSTETPLFYQLSRLRDRIQSDLRDRDITENFILLGDLNFPKTFMEETKAYQIFSHFLNDALAENKIPTWPMPSSDWGKKSPIQMQIDHIFAHPNTNITDARVLPLKGSDHAALWVELEL